MRNKLWLAAAALTLAVAGGAAAYARGTITARNGYWVVLHADDPPACFVSSQFAQLGTMLSIGVSSLDDRLRIVFTKRDWHVPVGTQVPVRMQIDNFGVWSRGGTFSITQGRSVATYIARDRYRQFYNELTSGSTFVATFGGDEPPWRFSLRGLAGLERSWINCVRRVAPGFLDTVPRSTQPYSPTQPYGNDAPTQPYGDNGGGDAATQPF